MTRENHQPDEMSYTPKMDAKPRRAHYVICEPGSTAPIVCPLLRESSTMQPLLTGSIHIDIQSQTAAGVRSIQKVEITAEQFKLLYPVKDAIRYSRAAFGFCQRVTDDLLIALQSNCVWTIGDYGRVVSAYTETTVAVTRNGVICRTLVPVISNNTLNVIFED